MKRMTSREFTKLCNRLRKKGWVVSRPYPSRFWRHLRVPRSYWSLSRVTSFNPVLRHRLGSREEVVRWARYILDGGPKP